MLPARITAGMSQAQLIADLNKSVAGLLKMHLADLSDADLAVRPVPAANHALWQLTHLASFEAMVAHAVNPAEPVVLPASFTDRTNGKASAIDDPAQFPTKAEIVDVLDRSHAAIMAGLPKLTDEQLAAPAPEAVRGFAPRLVDLVSMAPMHVMMHLGQIQVLRRALGKPRVF